MLASDQAYCVDVDDVVSDAVTVWLRLRTDRRRYKDKHVLNLTVVTALYCTYGTAVYGEI